MKITTLQVKTFSEYNLLDLKDFYTKVYNHLLKTNQAFCFYNGSLISRETCKPFLYL